MMKLVGLPLKARIGGSSKRFLIVSGAGLSFLKGRPYVKNARHATKSYEALRVKSSTSSIINKRKRAKALQKAVKNLL